MSMRKGQAARHPARRTAGKKTEATKPSPILLNLNTRSTQSCLSGNPLFLRERKVRNTGRRLKGEDPSTSLHSARAHGRGQGRLKGKEGRRPKAED